MAKALSKKAAGKISGSISYVKDAVDKIRDKSWAKPTGTALSATASIVEHLEWIPGVSIIGGALKMGSSLLNPAPSLADIKEQVKELENHMDSSIGFMKEVLEQKIKELKRNRKELLQVNLKTTLKTI